MTHEDKIIEEFTKPQIIVDKFGKKIGESQWSPYCIEQLRQALTTYRTQVLEEVGREVVKMEDHTDMAGDFFEGKKLGHNQALDKVLLYLSHKHPTN